LRDQSKLKDNSNDVTIGVHSSKKVKQQLIELAKHFEMGMSGYFNMIIEKEYSTLTYQIKMRAAVISTAIEWGIKERIAKSLCTVEDLGKVFSEEKYEIFSEEVNRKINADKNINTLTP
jgi:hypothetical protein